jgi:serine/threonine protein kinase
MSLESGTRLGPYVIESPAGAGGMGEVYQARDTRLERTVAIKILPSHLSGQAALRQRFDREAKTISGLQHPNICALFDVGHENGTDYLVMEYLEGETLAERLKRGPIPQPELLRFAVQIAEALDAAHRHGVIHRDLKPGNVMLTRTGVKLLDFGLAKVAQGPEEKQSSLTQAATGEHASDPLTAKGTILGTYQYMSPEQLEGEETDARSDIFSLGAVLYEMATGRRAFEGRSQASLIASIMSSQPAPISTLQPMTPPVLDRVVSTCLEKHPDDRWQSAHAVAVQLKWVEEGGSQVGIPKPVATRRKSRERIAWIVAAVATCAALALAALRILSPAPPAPATVRFTIPAPKSLTWIGSPRISPDGRYIAFNGIDETKTTMLWVRPMNSLEAHPLPGTEGSGRPFWSPDSRDLGFFAGGKLKRIPVSGGPPLALCDFARGADGTWGRNGTILFDGSSSGDSVMAVPAGGGNPTGAVRNDRERGVTSSGWPDFLPDGKRFVYISFIRSGPDEIRLGRLGSFETTKLTEGDSRVEYVPPGYLVYERDGTLLAQPFDAGAGKLDGDPFPLAEGIGTGGAGLADFSGSANGTLIFTEGESPDSRLVWFDREGHEQQVIGEAARYRGPALSPDGSRVLVTVRDPGTESRDLWVIDIARGVRSRLTFDPGDEWNGAWSPDGSRIAFSSTRDGQTDVFIKSATGTGEEQQLTDTPASEGVGQWTPDGWILGIRPTPESSYDVVRFPADGGEEEAIIHSPFTETQGRVSPDGRYLTYTSNETGTFEVYVTTYPAGEGKWQVSSGGASEPRWRPDGRELYYLDYDRSLMAVEVTLEPRLEFGSPVKLFTAPVSRNGVTRNRYVVGPDGKRFLLVCPLDQSPTPSTTVVMNWAAELRDR